MQLAGFPRRAALSSRPRWILPQCPRIEWSSTFGVFKECVRSQQFLHTTHAKNNDGRDWTGGAKERDSQSSKTRRPRDHRADRSAGHAGDWGKQNRYPATPPKSTYKEQMVSAEVLYGVAPVLAALRAGRRTPHALLVQEGLDHGARKDSKALQEIQALAAAAGAPCRVYSKHDLNMLTDSRPHQGLVLDCSPLEWQQLDEFPAAREVLDKAAAASSRETQAGSSSGTVAPSESSCSPYPVWLALDEVTDPQNLGAMVRSAYCLGAAGVLASSRNCAPLSAVVSKASAGAVEVMPMHNCRMMHRTLADAAAKGWAVVGAAAGPGSVPVTKWVVDKPTVLVMGNEGYGLRTVVRRTCTGMVEVEMHPAGDVALGGNSSRLAAVDSLNVSVATGILLHHMIASARAPVKHL